jgi:hypothetical protein
MGIITVCVLTFKFRCTEWDSNNFNIVLQPAINNSSLTKKRGFKVNFVTISVYCGSKGSPNIGDPATYREFTFLTAVLNFRQHFRKIFIRKFVFAKSVLLKRLLELFAFAIVLLCKIVVFNVKEINGLVLSLFKQTIETKSIAFTNSTETRTRNKQLPSSTLSGFN